MTTNHMFGIFFKKQIKDCKKKNNKTVTIKIVKTKSKNYCLKKFPQISTDRLYIAFL